MNRLTQEECISRRTIVSAGLFGLLAAGMGTLDAACAFADENVEQGNQLVDLTTLSDEDLLALEANLRTEKIRRQMNTAVVPQGYYIAGTDFAAGTYTVSAIADGNDHGRDIAVYETQDKSNQISWDYIDGGESVKISLVDGNLLSLRTGNFALSPFTIDFGGATSAEATAPQDQPTAEASSVPSSGEVTPEFKEMIDSYEAFMNQYCDFMVKYADATSSGDSATLLAMTADYASLVQQELDWAGKIDDIDESTLSPADDAYYLEVQGRVLKKLGETGVSLS